MSNSALLGKKYDVKDPDLIKYLGTSLSYENMKKIKSEMEDFKEKGNKDLYKNKGGDKILKWIDDNLKQDRNSIHNEKKIRMDAGEENQFKKEHTKDKLNANPTGLNIPKVHKGSVERQITTNKINYEQEIKDIKYLIEYLCNNNNKQII